MFQKPLRPNEGALFVFEEPSIAYFWNKNVQFPIDVAFFNRDGKLIDIQHMIANQTQPVFSSGTYNYVIEAPLGWFMRNKVIYGTNLEDLINEQIL